MNVGSSWEVTVDTRKYKNTHKKVESQVSPHLSQIVQSLFFLLRTLIYGDTWEGKMLFGHPLSILCVATKSFPYESPTRTSTHHHSLCQLHRNCREALEAPVKDEILRSVSSKGPFLLQQFFLASFLKAGAFHSPETHWDESFLFEPIRWNSQVITATQRPHALHIFQSTPMLLYRIIPSYRAISIFPSPLQKIKNC